jgi:hypothetical protein
MSPVHSSSKMTNAAVGRSSFCARPCRRPMMRATTPARSSRRAPTGAVNVSTERGGPRSS